MIRIMAALAAGLPLALLAAPASADNCFGGAFAGAYLGSTIGYARSTGEQKSPPDDPDLKGHDDGFSGTSIAGYNLQCGNVVIGIEGDIGYLGLVTKTSWSGPDVFLGSKIDWFGTVRGRLGTTVATDTLLYVTAGLALADIEHKLHVPSKSDFRQKDDDFAAGWTVGGGIELVRDTNWLVRAEALYVDLGDESHTYTNGCGCSDTVKWEDSFWVARVGISYKFGEAERHRPLK